MILILYQLSRQPNVDLTENDNQDGVDYTRQILPGDGHFSIWVLSIADIPLDPLEADLGAEHEQHEDE